MWETALNRLCEMKTEKQTSDSALQVTADSNDQFQWKRDDESLTGVCFKAGEKLKKVNTDNSLEGFCCKLERKMSVKC